MAYTPPTFGTSTANAGEELYKKLQIQNEKDKEEEEKKACIARGGVWDSKTKTCSMPDLSKINKTETAAPIPTTPRANIPAGTVETFKSSDTGRQSGVVLPDGRTFLGLNPEDVNKIAQGEASRVAIPENAAPVGTAQAQANRQAQIQRLVQAAQAGLLTTEELQQIGGADVDWNQALGAGAVGVIPGLIGGAASGAVIGGVAGVGIGAVPGAIIGAIAGGIGTFLTSTRSNIKGQQTGEFTADREALTKGERYLRSLITDTNQNPQNAPENIALFYKTLNMINAAHRKTWADSQETLNIFLGNDGTPQLAKFDVFDTTMRQYYISQFNTALNAPDPSRILITAEDLGVDLEE